MSDGNPPGGPERFGMPMHEALCRAMADPGFYPHPVTDVQQRHTHISSVFLTGRVAYKLKKPLDLGFLDFTTLARRRRACMREVALNRRFSSGVYHGVLTVTAEGGGGFALNGKGKPVQAVVQMRQLPEAASLRQRLLNGRMREKEIRRLGRYLAQCHGAAPRHPTIDRYGGRRRIALNLEENTVQLQPFVGRFLNPDRVAFIDQVSRAFLVNRRAVFQRRRTQGRICDGHGDLRCDHVYFYRGIQILDGVEFNDKFRCGDTALDMAFLTMDLDHLGFGDLARILLEAYVVATQDPGLFAVLDFYAAYRAMVRLKIACLTIDQVPSAQSARPRAQAQLYLEQAYRCALQFSRPVLWVVCGLPGTGKSTLAEGLHRALQWDWLQSDALRKQSCQTEGTVLAYGQKCYQRQWRDRVYTQMFGQIQQRLKAGRSVIADATFSRRKWRREAARLAALADAGLVVVECRCDEAVICERLARRSDSQGLSDARIEHWPALRDEFEPICECSPRTHVTVNTGQDAIHALSRALCQAHGCLQEQILMKY